MILSIHQPSYWPWLGLLDKIAKSNTFILLDDVQLVKGSYQYRNKFFCEGKPRFITIPLFLKLGINIKEVEFRNDKWREDHLNKLRNYYFKAPFFKEVYSDLMVFYDKFYTKPIDLLKGSMIFSMQMLNINVELFLSSIFNVTGTKGDMVLNLCKAVKAKKYLAGTGSYAYMHEYLPKFDGAGIEINWHAFKHPNYEQNPEYPFIEGLSCMDIFFFQGYKKSRDIFWRNI